MSCWRDEEKCWFKAWLGEALLLDGDRRRTQAEAAQTVEIGKRFDNTYSVALAMRVLGRAALEDGMSAVRMDYSGRRSIRSKQFNADSRPRARTST